MIHKVGTIECLFICLDSLPYTYLPYILKVMG